jgi:dTMP kinase
MNHGKLIVLEGIDGAGTTTHTKILCDRLRAAGRPALATHEPSTGPIGLLLRQILGGRVVVPTSSGPTAPTWTTMALLFAADRMDHLQSVINPNLHDGVTVVCDRYDYSSVVYQSVTSPEDGNAVEWIMQLNRHARRPDLTLVLDVPAHVAAQRRAERGERELYDDDPLQAALAECYRQVPTWFARDRIFLIDANRPVDQVSDEVWARVQALG